MCAGPLPAYFRFEIPTPSPATATPTQHSSVSTVDERNLDTRANNDGTGSLVGGVTRNGNQFYARGNINYTGRTTIRTSARLTLDNTANFGSFITNSGPLGLRTVPGNTLNLNKIITGSGSLLRDGGGVNVSYTNLPLPTNGEVYIPLNSVIQTKIRE